MDLITLTEGKLDLKDIQDIPLDGKIVIPTMDEEKAKIISDKLKKDDKMNEPNFIFYEDSDIDMKKPLSIKTTELNTKKENMKKEHNKNLGFDIGDRIEYNGKKGKIKSFGSHDEATKIKFDDGTEDEVDIKKIAYIKENKIDGEWLVQYISPDGTIKYHGYDGEPESIKNSDSVQRFKNKEKALWLADKIRKDMDEYSYMKDEWEEINVVNANEVFTDNQYTKKKECMNNDKISNLINIIKELPENYREDVLADLNIEDTEDLEQSLYNLSEEELNLLEELLCDDTEESINKSTMEFTTNYLKRQLRE
jgi:hypothetical protein